MIAVFCLQSEKNITLWRVKLNNAVLSFFGFLLTPECTSYDQTRHQYYSFTDIKTSSIIHPAKIY